MPISHISYNTGVASAGGLVPQSVRGGVWSGAAHAADWYTTIAALAGASADDTGPLPPDGVDLWTAIVSNGTSPRSEVVLQIVSNSSNNAFQLPSQEYPPSLTFSFFGPHSRHTPHTCTNAHSPAHRAAHAYGKVL